MKKACESFEQATAAGPKYVLACGLAWQPALVPGIAFLT